MAVHLQRRFRSEDLPPARSKPGYRKFTGRSCCIICAALSSAQHMAKIAGSEMAVSRRNVADLNNIPIEQIGDKTIYLREVSRATAPQGFLVSLSIFYRRIRVASNSATAVYQQGKHDFRENPDDESDHFDAFSGIYKWHLTCISRLQQRG